VNRSGFFVGEKVLKSWVSDIKIVHGSDRMYRIDRIQIWKPGTEEAKEEKVWLRHFQIKRSSSCLAKGFGLIRSPRRPLRNPQIYESGKQEGRKTEGGPKDTQIKRNVFPSPSPQIAGISIYLSF
jgi:hypothetical protein